MRTGLRTFLLGALLLPACATYYQVSVPASGKVYYTEDVSRQRSGAVSFVDAATGDTVVLQASEVLEIGSDQFREGTKGRALLVSGAAEGSKLAVQVGYVSAAHAMGAAGKAHRADAIYVVRVQGAHLDRQQMFELGWNGFRYQVELDNPTPEQSERYRATAFPLTGVRYSEDGQQSASLVPSPITFQWMGPRPDGAKRSLKVTQLARDLKSGKDVVVGAPVVVALPPAEAAPPDLTGWVVRMEVSETSVHFNGVSAFPLRVKITSRLDGTDAPPAIYDRLAFYAKDARGAVIPDRVLGADPTGPEALAVLPSLWGKGANELRTPTPRYGESSRGAPPAPGRGLFYVVAGRGPAGGDTVRKICIQLLDDGGSVVVPNDFQVQDRNEKVTGRMEPPTAGPNSETVRTVYLESDGAERTPYLSDPTRGDFDFVLDRAGSAADAPHFLLALLPEGLNEREIHARFDFSTFRRGFFLKPVAAGGVVTGFEVADRTSSLQSTWGRNAYAYVFDVHGRYSARELFRDDGKKVVRKWESGMEAPVALRWDDESTARVPEERWSERFMVCEENASALPVVFSVWGEVRDQGVQYKNRTHGETSIVAGPRTKTCYATGEDQVLNKKTKFEWKVDGRSWTTPADVRFQDRLRAYKHIAGSGGRICMKSERKYARDSSSRPPYGADVKVWVAYEGTDSFVPRWENRYLDWASVVEGEKTKKGVWIPETGGKTWAPWVLGGDFDGCMKRDSFKAGDWSEDKWEKWTDD